MLGGGGGSIGLASYLGGRSSTPSPFMPWKQGWVPSGEATWLECRHTFSSDDDFCPWLLELLDQRSLPTITVLTRTSLTWVSKLHDWYWLQVITFFVWFLCCFSVDVCQRFLQDEEILLLAVGAIQNLVRDSYVNRCRLADSDGLIVLSRIYRASESEAIKTKCLHALRNLVGKYMWVIYSLLWAGIWAFHRRACVRGSILASKSRLVFRRPFDWLKACRELFWPITERSKAKAKKSGITFDPRLKISLKIIKSFVSAHLVG